MYKIPRRARCGRKNKAIKGQTIAYIKNKKRDAYYLMHSDNSIEELTFVEAARLYKAEITERATELPEFHYEQINTALNSFLEDVVRSLNFGVKYLELENKKKYYLNKLYSYLQIVVRIILLWKC